MRCSCIMHDQTYRKDDAAAFLVFFTNLGTEDVINPQTRVVVWINSHDYPCQGYISPTSHEVVLEASDVRAKPLIVPAEEGTFVTILCHVLETDLDNASLTLH